MDLLTSPDSLSVGVSFLLVLPDLALVTLLAGGILVAVGFGGEDDLGFGFSLTAGECHTLANCREPGFTYTEALFRPLVSAGEPGLGAWGLANTVCLLERPVTARGSLNSGPVTSLVTYTDVLK